MSEKPSCEELFQNSALEGAELQDAVYANHPDGACEKVSVSRHSRGPVMDRELLTRLAVHPIHYDAERGTLSPLSFQDATTLDLSLFREDIATDQEIQLAIDEIVATGRAKLPTPQSRYIDVVLQAQAGELRSLMSRDGAERLIRLYDTAEELKPAHASGFTPPTARKGAGQRHARKELLRVFEKRIVPIEDYRSLNYSGSVDATPDEQSSTA